jgi:hypothetical protein
MRRWWRFCGGKGAKTMRRGSWRMISLPNCSRVEPSRARSRSAGRFRSYLLGALKHFAADQRDKAIAAKSVVEASEHAEIDAEMKWPMRPQTSPDAAFDRQWALTVLARKFEPLEAEMAAEGKDGAL